jgi:hypothetical protein
VISAAQAAQYLDQALGISLPAFLVAAAVEKVEALEPAMVAAGYAEADMTLIQCMAVALIAAAGAPRRLSSQGAPSGASRSFKTLDGDLTALRRALAARDTAGITSQVVGPDPSTSTAFIVTC